MLSEGEQKILYNYYVDEKLANIINFINNRDDLENIKNAIINAKKGFNFDITNLKLEKVKNILNEYFNIKKVLYYPTTPSRFKFLRQKTYENLSPMSPFDIPITYIPCEEKKLKCSVIRSIPMQKLGNIQVIQSINFTPSNIMATTYAHEITHTQYQSKEFIYDEILPIFVEELINSLTDNNKIIFYARINNLLECLKELNKNPFPQDEIEEFNKLNTIKYIESTLKAYMLYHIYTNEPLSSTKARIIDDVQSVIDGTISIENLISKYELTDKNTKSLTLFKRYFK